RSGMPSSLLWITNRSPDQPIWDSALGNEPTHNTDPVDHKDADEVYEFTSMFCQVIYSIPARVQQKLDEQKARKDASKKAASP
ncbi:MAG: hypothetical protein AAF411_21070, partial [Myxococcota bacterium]